MIDKKATKWLKIFGYIVITFFVAIIIFVGTRTIRSSSDSRKVKESERSVVGSPQIGFSSREEFNSKWNESVSEMANNLRNSQNNSDPTLYIGFLDSIHINSLSIQDGLSEFDKKSLVKFSTLILLKVQIAEFCILIQKPINLMVFPYRQLTMLLQIHS